MRVRKRRSGYLGVGAGLAAHDDHGAAGVLEDVVAQRTDQAVAVMASITEPSSSARLMAHFRAATDGRDPSTPTTMRGVLLVLAGIVTRLSFSFLWA